jgi:hypothetical protein
MVVETIIDFLRNPAVASGLLVFGRNIYGWINRSMEDGKIEDYEWKQLGKTLIQLGGFSIFAYLGINALFPGVVGPTESTALVAFVDVLRSYFKKGAIKPVEAKVETY